MHTSVVQSLAFLTIGAQIWFAFVDRRETFDTGYQLVIGDITNFNLHNLHLNRGNDSYRKRRRG